MNKNQDQFKGLSVGQKMNTSNAVLRAANNSLKATYKHPRLFGDKRSIAKEGGAKQLASDMNENNREIATFRNLNKPVSELQKAAERGEMTEISGDAIARAKSGANPKIIRRD